jgi:maltokinase
MMREQLAAYISGARWFGGKGRAFEVTDIATYDLAPGVSTNLVTLVYADGEELYQLPLSSYDEPQERLSHALVGDWDGRIHYDAVHDRDAMHVWLQAFTGEAPTDDQIAFRRTDDHELDTSTHSSLYSGEQSNSSLAFGEDSLLKVFRRLTPGVNPDIEIHEALTRAASTHVAALHGYAAVTTPSGEELQVAMLQQFLRTASDGWELALASARNLFTEGDLHADEVGGDFASEAYRLGSTLAEVHAVLAETFGTVPLDLEAVGLAMTQRLDDAIEIVSELAEHTDGLRKRFAALTGLTGAAPAHRVHGDLHLGQTLRTSLGWKLVDFEGEPAKDLAERRLPDSPWRDVAGMIRSFDYAASTVARDLGATSDEASQVAYRSGEWTAHNTAAFLTGYAEERGLPMTADERVLLDAYVADKAVYEATYEARNRPGWLAIPLQALARIGGAP